MKKQLAVIAVLCAAWLAPVLAPAQAAAQRERAPIVRRAAPSDAATARVIVRFKADSGLARALSATPAVGLKHAATLSRRHGVTLADGLSIDDRTQVMMASGMSSEALAELLAADPEVESVGVDRRKHLMAAPNDPRYASAVSPAAGQWYLHAADSTLVSAINAEAAWALSTGSSNVVVAVLDTGVRPDHPDLAGKLLPGYDFVSDTTVSNDGDGRDSDPSDPGDWETGIDSSWHGTQTAGLVGAATNNGIGMASIGRDVMVLPVRVLGTGGGFDSDIQAGMRWAAGLAVPGVPANLRPAKVISLSLGGTGTCGAASGYPAAINEVRAAGVVVVVSAGNDGLAVNEPANCSGVVAVAGLRHAGSKVGYSSLGPQVTIAAPAGNCLTGNTCQYPLLTTSNTGTTVPLANTYTTGGDDASYGTSFAAPLVSGTLGLMFSVNPALTAAQAISALRSSARPFPTTGGEPGSPTCQAPNAVAQDSECYCTTSTCGAGMLDAGAAVALAAGQVPVSASIAPSASSVVVGNSVTLDAGGSRAGTGRTIASYRWAITTGAGLASLSAPNDAVTSLLASAAGTVTVTLTVTDSGGGVAVATQSVTVTSPPPVASGGGGGGGALGAPWLLLLAAALFALRRETGSRGR